jgi:hypothetical protein
VKRRLGRRTAGRQGPPDISGPVAGESLPGSPPGPPRRACCCLAWPVVQVIMPPTAQRPHPVDLWLCGHHYRVCRDALAAVGATVHHLPERAGIVRTVLSDIPDRSRAGAA